MKHIKVIAFLSVILITFANIYAKTYTIEIGQFEKLKVNGNMSLVYKNLPDSTGFARYEAPEENDGLFLFSTKGDGSLKVEPADERWGNTDLPVLSVYSDFLSSVESYSDQSVDISSMAPCATFNVNQIGNGSISVDNVKCNIVTAAITTGNGSIYLNGRCITANFRMLGAGLISADQLQSEVVKCKILGTGSIGCWPVEDLSVTGLGSTKIYYKGKPNIKKKGGGKLFELPEEMETPEGVEVPSFNTSESEITASNISMDDNEDEDNDDDDEDEDDNDDEDEEFQTVVTSDD